MPTAGSLTLLVLFALLLLLQPPSARAVLVDEPCCSSFPHLGAAFGPSLPFFSPGVRAELSLSLKGCEESVEGRVVLVRRADNVLFSDLVLQCQQRGAVGVIVCNDDKHGDSSSALVRMGGQAPGVTIPSVFVSRRAGQELERIVAEWEAEADKEPVQPEDVVDDKKDPSPLPLPVRPRPTVQLSLADDFGYLYGALLFVLPLMLGALFSALFVVLLCRAACCRSSSSRHRRHGGGGELDLPFLGGDVEQGGTTTVTVATVATVPTTTTTTELKVFPVVQGEAQQPNPKPAAATSVRLTLVNGDPVFDQQAE